MAAKSKLRERGALAPIHPVKSLVLRDVTPPTGAAHAATRRRPSVIPAAVGASKPARLRATRAMQSS